MRHIQVKIRMGAEIMIIGALLYANKMYGFPVCRYTDKKYMVEERVGDSLYIATLIKVQDLF